MRGYTCTVAGLSCQPLPKGTNLITVDPIDKVTVPGAVIAGQYEVVRTLGEGAMGAVVLARDQALDRAVALKFLKPAVSDLFDSDRRFQQEARLLSRLSHPNVVTIYSFGEDENGVRYIAMEYIEGHTLEPHIEQDFLLPLDDLAHVVDQIASALAEAHDRGVIHRDIKPGNILLTSVGADQRYAKVVDFGLAKASESAAEGFGSSAAVSTQERGLALGTPAYISPEQALGTQVDARADVYGLAALIVRLLTGSLLFPGAQGAAQMLIAHATKPPPPISELGKWRGFEPGSALERVLLRALEKRPAHRYHNISVFSTEFVEAIYALRRAAPVGVFSLTESAALSTVLPDDALEQTLVGTEAAPIVESTATWSQQAVLLVSLDRLWSRDEDLGADEALDVMATVAARLQQAVREAGVEPRAG